MSIVKSIIGVLDGGWGGFQADNVHDARSETADKSLLGMQQWVDMANEIPLPGGEQHRHACVLEVLAASQVLLTITLRTQSALESVRYQTLLH